MRTSLNDIKLIEHYLYNELSPSDQVLVEARLLIEPELKKNVILQKQVYKLIGLYHAQNLRTELERFHTMLFNDPLKKDFRKKIMNLFKKDSL